MYTEKDKERITISVQKKLLTKIDEASKKAGFTRAKYLNRVLSEIHNNDADCDVKNALDAVISLSKNPHNWMRIPREFRTYDVYRALVSVCPADAVSILELVPPEWWSLINKESIIKQAAKNIKILYNLPCEYRNDALTCICETAKTAGLNRTCRISVVPKKIALQIYANDRHPTTYFPFCFLCRLREFPKNRASPFGGREGEGTTYCFRWFSCVKKCVSLYVKRCGYIELIR